MPDATNPEQLGIAEPSAEDAERASKRFRAIWELEEAAPAPNSEAVLARPIVPLTSGSSPTSPPDSPVPLQRTVIGIASPPRSAQLTADLEAAALTPPPLERTAPLLPASVPAGNATPAPSAPPAAAPALGRTMVGVGMAPTAQSLLAPLASPAPAPAGFPTSSPPVGRVSQPPMVSTHRPPLPSFDDSVPPLRSGPNKAVVVLILASLALAVFVVTRLLDSSEPEPEPSSAPRGRTESVPAR